jgi:aminomethyltransferase
LYPCHLESNARIVEYAGWQMPVQYSGVIAECKAVRSSAGMFDVSHMGRTKFFGEGAFDLLENLTTNDVSNLADHGSQYSMLCYPDGTVVDDIYVYRIAGDEFRVIINAANLEDETEFTAMIAVQGPSAREKVQAVASEDLMRIEKYHSAECTVGGVRTFVGRTGYTGEDGFELVMPSDFAPDIWRALINQGVVPCGLAARDALRVEAGLPLYGHEISDKINPIEAGLGWVCSKTKTFIGSDAVNKMRAERPSKKLVGVRMNSKMIPREGYELYRGGQRIGVMTSGVFSPLLDCGIGFAFAASEHSAPGECELLVRGAMIPAQIVGKRFLADARAAQEAAKT